MKENKTVRVASGICIVTSVTGRLIDIIEIQPTVIKSGRLNSLSEKTLARVIKSMLTGEISRITISSVNYEESK